MHVKKLGLGLLAAAVLAVPVWVAPTSATAAESVFIPQASYRTGGYSVNGIPFANGFSDYLHLLNARDGGIEGVKIETE